MNGVSLMQLIFCNDAHNYGDKQSIQNMVVMFSLPFSQSHILLIYIYISYVDCGVWYAVHRHTLLAKKVVTPPDDVSFLL